MKEHRSGEKFGGEHTTFVGLSQEIADVLVKMPEVKSISPGYITSGIGRGTSRRSVKIIDELGCVLLTVVQSGSAQEMRVYTSNRQDTKLALARWLRDKRIDIKFMDKRNLA